MRPKIRVAVERDPQQAQQGQSHQGSRPKWKKHAGAQ
jgi:hypothetical protein